MKERRRKLWRQLIKDKHRRGIEKQTVNLDLNGVKKNRPEEGL